jgi:hypothetical protein
MLNQLAPGQALPDPVMDYSPLVPVAPTLPPPPPLPKSTNGGSAPHPPSARPATTNSSSSVTVSVSANDAPGASLRTTQKRQRGDDDDAVVDKDSTQGSRSSNVISSAASEAASVAAAPRSIPEKSSSESQSFKRTKNVSFDDSVRKITGSVSAVQAPSSVAGAASLVAPSKDNSHVSGAAVGAVVLPEEDPKEGNSDEGYDYYWTEEAASDADEESNSGANVTPGAERDSNGGDAMFQSLNNDNDHNLENNDYENFVDQDGACCGEVTYSWDSGEGGGEENGLSVSKEYLVRSSSRSTASVEEEADREDEEEGEGEEGEGRGRRNQTKSVSLRRAELFEQRVLSSGALSAVGSGSGSGTHSDSSATISTRDGRGGGVAAAAAANRPPPLRSLGLMSGGGNGNSSMSLNSTSTCGGSSDDDDDLSDFEGMLMRHRTSPKAAAAVAAGGFHAGKSVNEVSSSNDNSDNSS